MVDLPVITATYTIGFPIDYILTPTSGSDVTDLQTITLEFPENTNVAFYENNPMPVAVLVNETTSMEYACETAERDTRAETAGIKFILNFLDTSVEEPVQAPISEVGIYTLTIRALALTDGEDNAIAYDLPVISATYFITTDGVQAAKMINEDVYNVYTINGIQVIRNGNADSLGILDAGLYIINGKKVIIRK